MPVSTTVSTGQYHSAVICAQRTRRAAPRRKGRSVRRISLVGLRNDASALATFQMAANCAAAKQVPRCLQSVQPVQAVDCTLFRSLSLVVLLSGTVAHPVCHCWCDSSHLVVVVHVLLSLVLSASLPPHAIHSRPTFCVTCCPQQSMLPSVRFAFMRYLALFCILH
jgi:hypothetical protein